MPNPPDIPGFYYDAEKNKYFKITNGNEQRNTPYHNNSVQAQRRRVRNKSLYKKSSQQRQTFSGAAKDFPGWSKKLYQYKKHGMRTPKLTPFSPEDGSLIPRETDKAISSPQDGSSIPQETDKATSSPQDGPSNPQDSDEPTSDSEDGSPDTREPDKPTLPRWSFDDFESMRQHGFRDVDKSKMTFSHLTSLKERRRVDWADPYARVSTVLVEDISCMIYSKSTRICLRPLSKTSNEDIAYYDDPWIDQSETDSFTVANIVACGDLSFIEYQRLDPSDNRKTFHRTLLRWSRNPSRNPAIDHILQPTKIEPNKENFGLRESKWTESVCISNQFLIMIHPDQKVYYHLIKQYKAFPVYFEGKATNLNDDLFRLGNDSDSSYLAKLNKLRHGPKGNHADSPTLSYHRIPKEDPYILGLCSAQIQNPRLMYINNACFCGLAYVSRVWTLNRKLMFAPNASTTDFVKTIQHESDSKSFIINHDEKILDFYIFEPAVNFIISSNDSDHNVKRMDVLVLGVSNIKIYHLYQDSQMKLNFMKESPFTQIAYYPEQVTIRGSAMIDYNLIVQCSHYTLQVVNLLDPHYKPHFIRLQLEYMPDTSRIRCLIPDNNKEGFHLHCVSTSTEISDEFPDYTYATLHIYG